MSNEPSAKENIILFDIPTREPRQSSSLNVWKTRAMLNFKGIPYETKWLEYSEIADTLRSFGIPKNEQGTAYTEYWLPAVRMPDGTYIMESYNIALALEKLYPDPPLQVTSKHTEEAQGIIDRQMYSIAPAYIYRLADDVFNPSMRDWYHQQRGSLFGCSDLYEVAKLEPYAGETPWKNADESFQDLAKLLESDKTGPFVMGSQPSYADFVIGGWWKGLQLLDREGDVFGRVMKMHASFPQHENACREWYKRASY